MSRKPPAPAKARPGPGRKKQKPNNPGAFKKGYDPRRRCGFTTEQCRKGYQAAKRKMDERSPQASAWFFRRIRGWYRKKRREEAHVA
jgi:hypothetical protein